MRTSLILAATLVLTGSAFAQMAPMAPAAGQFCVRGDSGANKGIENCVYQTMAQCEAVKGSGEKCVPNAQLKSGPKAAATSGSKAAGSDKMKSAAGASKSTTGSGSKN